jgi:membrane-bound serine protease (ClpP class)
MRTIAAFLVLAGLTLWAVEPRVHAAAGPAPLVYLAHLDGPLGPARADLLIRALDDAEAAQAAAFVIRLDTPGGLDKSMRDLVKRILAARIPVIAWVGPDGARAASAGTYVVYASHVAAMAPATNIGSSTPVSIAPVPQGPGRAPAGEQDAAPAADDAMTRKVVNDAAAWLQSLAELRGRNVEWAEATVRTGANLRATEALELGVVELLATDVQDLLGQLEGREIDLQGQRVSLSLAGARTVEVESDWLHDLLEIVSDPTIAYGLLIFGIYGLILEFYNPGLVFPSVIGIVCLLLGAYGLQMLPVNYAGLALIVVGIGMMIIEVFTPTFGALGVAGLVAFVFGSLILFDADSPEYRIPLSVIAGFGAATGALCLVAVGAAVRARRQRVVTGAEGMIGSRGEAMEAFAVDASGSARGRVFVHGEIWNAQCGTPLLRGQAVQVVSIEGLTLTVVPG